VALLDEIGDMASCLTLQRAISAQVDVTTNLATLQAQSAVTSSPKGDPETRANKVRIGTVSWRDNPAQ